MSKMLRTIIFSIFVAVIVSPALVTVQAQTPPPPPPPPVPYYRGNTDDNKGSVVRGRAFYQDSSAPVRRGWIGLLKIRELVVPKEEGGTKVMAVSSGYGADSYVLTNDQGEFTIKGVKAGIYQTHFKVQGVLNPTFADRENPLYPQISIDGISEISLQISATRGAAIGGKVSYADGEPAIGARVQAVSKKEGEKDVRYSYGGDDRTVTTTDDRGVYRFAGLPADDYFVRVIEPSVPNSGGSVSGYSIASYLSSSILTTFYPGVTEIADAKPLTVFSGQEQSEINIVIPDRRLFKMSGTVTAKNTKTPLKDLKVTFQKINGAAEQIVSYYNDSKQARTDEFGKWSFVDLPKGKYLIKVSNLETYEYNSKPSKSDAQPKLAPLTREIEIDNENPAELTFEMLPESAISGTVTVEGDGDKELPKYISLTAFDEQNRVVSSASINNIRDKDKPQPVKTASVFRIGALAAGKYSFNVNTEPGFYVKSVRGSGNADFLNSPIEIAEGQEITDVRVVLASDVGTLKGKIADYTPAEMTFALLLPVGKAGSGILTNVRQAVPNAAGDFSIPAAPGEYYVVIVNSRDRPKDGKIVEWLIKLTADAPKVTIRASETATITVNAPNR